MPKREAVRGGRGGRSNPFLSIGGIGTLTVGRSRGFPSVSPGRSLSLKRQRKTATFFMDGTTALPERPLLKPSEVARFFQVSVKTVYNWREVGLIKGKSLTPGCLRIYRSSVIAFIANGSTGS